MCPLWQPSGSQPSWEDNLLVSAQALLFKLLLQTDWRTSSCTIRGVHIKHMDLLLQHRSVLHTDVTAHLPL